MNDIMLYEINANKADNQYVSRKKGRFFASVKRKPKTNTFETRPLILCEDDSCSSEDEVTLHDIRQLNLVKKGLGHSKLTKVNKSQVNGNVSEHVKVSDPFRYYEFLDHKIEENDSLQSISIKYHCSISDLKRANKLINDQEFYALKHIKIPVKKYSLLTEVLPPVHNSKKGTTIVEEAENNVRVINIGIGGRSPSPQDTAAFFKRMDEDLVQIMLSTRSQKDSLEAATAALTARQIQPLVKDPYNTVDCGIQWNYLIICAIIFAITVPAIIALYLYLRSSHSHSQDVYPSVSSNDSFNSVSKLSIKAKS